MFFNEYIEFGFVNLESFKLELGKNIAHIRKRENMTQPELGALLNKDFQSISRIENGKVNISAHLLYELAKTLKVHVDELLDFSKKEDE
ncbi:MAG: XRE family transcriptional regulator [Chitinophagaceae bacterium]|nr:MAG: XRE family transcriptional regulator [Chitinophagaceae bacterium]